MPRAWFVFAAVLIPLVALAQPKADEARLVEAMQNAEGVWTLGEQMWDFGPIASVYQPVTGTLDAKSGTATWILELIVGLTSAEAGAQGAVLGSPFKPSFLDGQKLLLAGDARVKITPISGTKGDRVRMTVQLPKAEVLERTKLVRVGRRTELGF